MSVLPDALAPCDGPYRLRVANNEAGVFAWSHVSDERCTMLHDKVGNSIISMENQTTTMGQSPSAATPVQNVALSKEWWADMVREAGTSSILGQGTNVVCTSAGQTTSLVVDLIKSVVPAQQKANSGKYAESVASTSPRFKITSRQDGSIVSSFSSYVHIRVSRAAGAMQSDALIPGEADFQFAEAATAADRALARALRINIKVNGVQAMATTLERAIMQGVLLSFEGVEGGHVFEISLLEEQAEVSEESLPSDRGDCIVETSILLEIFSAETQLVQGRPSNEIVLSSGTISGDTEADEVDLQETRIVFVADLAVVDGYKLSTLHLMKHLPSNFRASTLDLSCACESRYVLLCCIA